MSGITSHVLDTNLGRPAAGVPVRLEYEVSGGWELLGQGRTNEDGRVGDLAAPLQKGNYRLVFDTAAVSEFFPQVSIVFCVHDPAQHYHVPLLISRFGYSTYRGS